MKRRDDWPERLVAVVQQAQARPFRWGEHDCALFVADCVKAMTGVDVAEGLRGSYQDRPGAIRRLAERFAVLDLRGLGTRLFGAPIAPALAQRGDVALVMLEGQGSAGVVLGPTVAAPGRRGLLHVPLERAEIVWGVGR